MLLHWYIIRETSCMKDLRGCMRILSLHHSSDSQELVLLFIQLEMPWASCTSRIRLRSWEQSQSCVDYTSSTTSWVIWMMPIQQLKLTIWFIRFFFREHSQISGWTRISYFAMLYSSAVDIDSWTPQTVDFVLFQGDSMYNSVHHEHVHFDYNELPRCDSDRILSSTFHCRWMSCQVAFGAYTFHYLPLY